MRAQPASSGGYPLAPWGSLIEAARHARGLSQQEAADRANVSRRWWPVVMSGRRGGEPWSPEAATIARCAWAVGITPQRLFPAHPEAAHLLSEMEPFRGLDGLSVESFSNTVGHVLEAMGEKTLEIIIDKAKQQLEIQRAVKFPRLRRRRS
jgi:transcriptional regulator with XRE-family HTH domain